MARMARENVMMRVLITPTSAAHPTVDRHYLSGPLRAFIPLLSVTMGEWLVAVAAAPWRGVLPRDWLAAPSPSSLPPSRLIGADRGPSRMTDYLHLITHRSAFLALGCRS